MIGFFLSSQKGAHVMTMGVCSLVQWVNILEHKQSKICNLKMTQNLTNCRP
jgi:hypothetical protein